MRCFLRDTIYINKQPIMKTLRLLPFIIVYILPFSIIQAQQVESRFWYVEEIEIKPKRIDDFKLALKEMAVSLEDQNYPYAYLVCESTKNKFFKFTNISHLNEVDNLNRITKSACKNMAHKTTRHYDHCIKTSNTFIIKDLPEYNYIPENPRIAWDDVKFATWEIHRVKSDQVEAYLDNLRNFQAIKRKYNYNDPSYIFKGAQGFELTTFIFLSYGKDEADRTQQDAYLWKVTGNEGKILFENFFPHIEDKQFIKFWPLKELSYDPMVIEDILLIMPRK